MIRRQLISLILVLLAPMAQAAPRVPATRPIVADPRSGRLSYNPEPNGDRVPDFSYCGYRASEVPIPNVPIHIVVPPIDGDNTTRIQAAIDDVSKLAPDADGFRGAVLLQAGRYQINGALRISASGVVLRGAGMDVENGTILVAAGLDRRTLITIAGTNDQKLSEASTSIADQYVPLGAMQMKLKSASGLKPGDTIVVTRPCTPEWIKLLKMEDMGGGMGSGWRPGSRDLHWDRTITAIAGDTITLDAPLTTSLDASLGDGNVKTYTWPGRISNVGVENLRCESTFDPSNAKDEAHSWIAIQFDSVRDGWVRQVIVSHFVSSAVAILDTCSRITVEDCKSLQPVSETAGYRRHTFFVNGTQTLVQRCWSEHGRHDYAVGFCAAGPNAFVQCDASQALDDSGAIDSWASGILFDNVRIDGAPLSLMDRRNNNFFAGWSAANSVIWQCSCSLINCFNPPGAHNWCIGSWGMFAGDGYFADSDNFVHPDSLFYGQLAQRLSKDVSQQAAIMQYDDTGASRNPKPEDAAAAIALATKPAPTMFQWVDAAPKRNPIPIDPGSAKVLTDMPPPSESPSPDHRIAITNGWITADGMLVTGARQGIKWWRGGMRPHEVAESIKDGPNLTRFAPGRIGRGLTDDLNQLADDMIGEHRVALDYHYGLWYDLRDIDHERTRRINGDAWPPFYEMPFARSGSDEPAWDGLSKYDLMKFNPWYWSRLKQFADIAERRKLILFNQNFFQHNILEAGAHWASCPWRSANNINNTGFPEPPPYSGDKLIYMAEQFYDETHPVRRAIYRNYIRKCLENFADNSNVIQFTSDEFTGPTHFVQFWLDTIGEWEKETGKKALIALSTPRDVQDAILADPARAALVSAIDIRYWWYEPKGDLYAPPGGKNLTPRQWSRGPKFPSFEQTQRAVREYRKKFPDKVILFGPQYGPTPAGWAVLMGGGSLPPIQNLDPQLLAAIPTMQPIDVPDSPNDQYVLGKDGGDYLVYCSSGSSAKLDLPSKVGKYALRLIDPRTGEISQPSDFSGSGRVEIKGTESAPFVLWLKHQ